MGLWRISVYLCFEATKESVVVEKELISKLCRVKGRKTKLFSEQLCAELLPSGRQFREGSPGLGGKWDRWWLVALPWGTGSTGSPQAFQVL